MSFHKSFHMVAESGNEPRQKRSRGDRGRESRDVNRNRKDEDEMEKQLGSGVDRAEIERSRSSTRRSSSRLLKCPGPQAEIELCSVRRNRFSMFSCRKWRNS